MTLVLIAAAWLAGIVLAAVDGSLWPLVLALGLGTSVGVTIAGRRESAAVALLLVPVALGGLVRYEAVRPSDAPSGVALYNEGTAVRLHGTIVSHPEDTGRAQRFTVRVKTLAVDGASEQPTTGSVLVTTRLFPRFGYGDHLTLEAELTTPPSFDDFDYREYLARQGVVSLAAFPRIERTGSGGGSWHVRLLDKVRRPLNDALERALPEPEAALARGMLLGERASIPDDVTDDFNTAGISHLVAISGSNVMLVAGVVLTTLTRVIGRRLAAIFSIVLILFFAALVGDAPPVWRSTAMATLVLGAMAAGRPASGLRIIILTAAALTLESPLIVQDVGFQLSVAAISGIVLIYEPVQAFLLRSTSRLLPARAAAPIASISGMTISASLFVLPITMQAFGRISLVALPANLFAVAAFPLILATSTVTAILGVVSGDLGSVAGVVAVWPLRYLVEVGRFFASVPGAAVDLRVGLLGAIALYVVLGAATAVFLRRSTDLDEREDEEPLDPHEPGGKRPRPLRVPPVLAASAVLFAASGFTLVSAALDSNDHLVVTILDVGQGDSILIETPQGHRILIDGGPSGDRLMQALGRELPANERDIDLVVLTHGQDDHVTGLVEVFARFNVAAVLAGPLPGTSAAYRAWADAVEREDADVLEAVAGEWLDLGDGVRLEVLGPPSSLLHGTVDDLNNNSVVLRLAYRDVSFLLTGDLAAEGETALLRGGANLRSSVLKVGHHGSDGSTMPALLAAVQPSYAAISVGAENTYGHPSPTTQLRLRDVPVARTDVNGRVRFETDGRSLWADIERGDFRRLSLEMPVAVPAR